LRGPGRHQRRYNQWCERREYEQERLDRKYQPMFAHHYKDFFVFR
jgi:hypothetical protein